MLGQLVRFGGVGGIATLTHVVVAMLAQSAGILAPLQANFAGFCAALVLSYFGHARITFDADPAHLAQAFRFTAIALVGLATSTSAVWVLNLRLGLDFGAAMAVVAVSVPAMTYLALRFWVFARTPDDAGAGLATTDLIVPALVSACLLALFWGHESNHDVAWYLLATRKWLDGAQLYIDLIEVNPPLAFYLTVPALTLAKLFGTSSDNGEFLFLAALTFASLVWSAGILRREPMLSSAARAGFVAILGLALIVPALDNMGQRDQLMLLMALPWIVGQLPSDRGPRAGRCARAALAAVGICLKPHFMIFPVTATLIDMARNRSLRPILSAENWTFLAVGLAYAGLVIVLHPTYFQQIVPVAREIYHAYSSSLDNVLMTSLPEALSLLILVLLVHRRIEGWPGARTFATMALAGWASYLAQGTGFAYHLLPMTGFTLAGYGWLIVANRARKTIAVAIAICAAPLPLSIASHGLYHNRYLPVITAPQIGWSNVQSYFALTTQLDVGPAIAHELGIEWSSRYPASWLVPGAINRMVQIDCTREEKICARLDEIATKNRSDNIDDILNNAPDLLLIDHQSFFFEQPFDWTGFMAVDPRWEQVQTRYRLIAESKDFSYYLHRGVAK